MSLILQGDACKHPGDHACGVWICVPTSKLSGKAGGLGEARPRLKKALIESTEKLKQWTGLAQQDRITSSKAAATWHVLPGMARIIPKDTKQNLTPDAFGRLHFPLGAGLSGLQNEGSKTCDAFELTAV